MKRVIYVISIVMIMLCFAGLLTACDQTSTPQTSECEHTEAVWETTAEATCTKAGTKQLICKKDSYIVDADDIAPLGHDSGEWQTTAATCTTDGVKKRLCTRDEFVLESTIIAAFGHRYVLTDGEPASCLKDGFEASVCENDSSHTKTTIIAALGHDSGEWQTVAATCTVAGTKTLFCTRDNFILSSTTIAALDHDYEITSTIDATCTEDGTKTYTCKNDSSHTYTDIIAALKHDYKLTNSDAATCTTSGNDYYTCKNNRSHKYEDSIPAFGHDDGEWQTTLPTCTDDGIKKLCCTRDYFVLDTEIISKLGHDYGSWTQFSEASSSSPKQLVRVCSRDTYHVKEYKYIAPEMELEMSTELFLTSNVEWFMLTLTKDTTVQVGVLQQGSGNLDYKVNVRFNDSNNNQLFYTSAIRVSVESIPAGTYFIKADNGGSTVPSMVRVFDFSKILADASVFNLDTDTQATAINNIGQWRKFTLTHDTAVNLTQTAENHIQTKLFSETNQKDSLLGTYTTDNKLCKLAAGTYYVHTYSSNRGSTPSASFKLADLTTILNDAPTLALGTQSKTYSINSNGVWFKVELTNDTPVNLVFTNLNSELSASVFLDDQSFTRLVKYSQNSITAYTASLPSGTSYVLLSKNSSAATVSGALTIEDFTPTLEGSKIINLNESFEIPAGTNASGWYKFVLDKETLISVQLSTERSFACRIFALDNISESLNSSSGLCKLQIGTYYLFVRQFSTTTTPTTIKIIDYLESLNKSPLLALGTASEISNSEDLWLIVVTEQVYIRMSITETLGSLQAFLYSENNLEWAISSASQGAPGGAQLDVGTYYVKVLVNGDGTISTGSLLVEKSV